jgi:hypothetical protein
MSTPPVNSVTDTTSLAAGDYGQTIILNQIFKQITTMLNTLQESAAAQANRLTFLTQWQQSYTDSLNQIHTFVAGDGDFAQGSASEQNNLNQLNTGYTQSMQNNQNIISNAAKSLQSTINNSNDAVSTQSTLGTSIIQEMSTLLSSIYK